MGAGAGEREESPAAEEDLADSLRQDERGATSLSYPGCAINVPLRSEFPGIKSCHY